MTRKFFALFLATFALTVAAQAITPTETGSSTTTLKSALAAEQTADDEDEGLFWFDAGANIASNYLWRGYDQSYSGKMFDPSIQPSVTLGLGDFYLDLWLNVSPMSTYQELIGLAQKRTMNYLQNKLVVLRSN